jgi:hypothetical protein
MFRGFAEIFTKQHQIACTSTGLQKEPITAKKIVMAPFFSRQKVEKKCWCQKNGRNIAKNGQKSSNKFDDTAPNCLH